MFRCLRFLHFHAPTPTLITLQTSLKRINFSGSSRWIISGVHIVCDYCSVTPDADPGLCAALYVWEECGHSFSLRIPQFLTCKTQFFSLKATVHTKHESLSAHPHADGRSGEALLSTKHFRSFKAKRRLPHSSKQLRPPGRMPGIVKHTGPKRLFPISSHCESLEELMIGHETKRYDTKQYDTTRSDTIRYDTKQYDTTRSDTIRYDTIRHDTTRCNRSH